MPRLAALVFLLSACDCPHSATSCPGSCDALKGRPIDLEASCAEPSETVGCWDAPEVGTADIGCVRRVRDDQVFVFSSGTESRHLIDDDTFVACSDDEWAVILRDPARCP